MLQTSSAKCITAGQDYIFVGCSEGVVRVFSATSLNYLCSLPKPHYLGVEVTAATNPRYMSTERVPLFFTFFFFILGFGAKTVLLEKGHNFRADQYLCLHI